MRIRVEPGVDGFRAFTDGAVVVGDDGTDRDLAGGQCVARQCHAASYVVLVAHAGLFGHSRQCRIMTRAGCG